MNVCAKAFGKADEHMHKNVLVRQRPSRLVSRLSPCIPFFSFLVYMFSFSMFVCRLKQCINIFASADDSVSLYVYTRIFSSGICRFISFLKTFSMNVCCRIFCLNTSIYICMNVHTPMLDRSFDELYIACEVHTHQIKN